ncbi:hypothetical protein HNQ93_002469 [Hymenobacter luteus]|uniref:Uncharacterized protein n=2 Tax=Hymenobacter TaxID=89966 RepID=A0A7W9T2I3_9BACT|nr:MULTISPECIES: hypothetical protein [Hymenobacter]MBB4601962.1 hypothetical protein [Hymenobacter latericoloratus]MBB6059609.1 hypothetical protein [Hymenobacter luteus]
MLTPLQFSQLVSAAWSGPAVAHHATISHYVAPGGYHYTQYQVSYHPSQGGCHFSQQECPFQAVAAAVAAAAAAGVPVSRHHAQRTIARTVAALCGVQLTRPGFACRARRHRVARLLYA